MADLAALFHCHCDPSVVPWVRSAVDDEALVPEADRSQCPHTHRWMSHLSVREAESTATVVVVKNYCVGSAANHMFHHGLQPAGSSSPDELSFVASKA